MITAPIIKTRRNKEELAAYERGKQSLITKLGQLVSANWDGMNEAAPNEKGFRVIVISLGLPTLDKQEGFVGLEYQRAPVAVSGNFTFDDGQRDLPGVGAGETTSSAPASDAPPAPGAFGPATTEPAPAETSTAPAVAPAASGKGSKGK